MKIGIFDSGFGGLSIMRAVVRHLPQYDYVYLGDTARTPYGTRSPDAVYEFTRQSVEFLFQQGCCVVILACNTASAEALARIQKEMLQSHPDRHILGVIIPAVESAAHETKNQKVGVLATTGTVRAGTFAQEIKKINSDIEITQQSCPMFVPLVESCEQEVSIIDYYAKKYTKTLKEAQVDTVILGCTHYEFLQENIQKALGNSVKIIAEGVVVAQSFERYLAQHPEIQERIGQSKKREFYTTDLSDHFVKNGCVFYGEDLDARKVRID